MHLFEFLHYSVSCRDVYLTSLVELAIHVDIGMDEYYTLVTNSKINILEVDTVTELEF